MTRFFFWCKGETAPFPEEGSSVGLMIGIAVVGILCVGGAIGFFLLRRKYQHKRLSEHKGNKHILLPTNRIRMPFYQSILSKL